MDNLDNNKKKRSEFRVGTKTGLLILFLVGTIFIIFSYTILLGKHIWEELIRLFGETFVSAAILSAIMEIHSIQEHYRKVRDYLLLEEPSFIERYTENEVDKIIKLGVKQKLKLNSQKSVNESILNEVINEKRFFVRTYIDNSIKLLGEKGYYCELHKRHISIIPMTDKTYRIYVTVEAELRNFTNEVIMEDLTCQQKYISQRQVDSFHICSFKIEGKDETNILKSLEKKCEAVPSTSKSSFDYKVGFTIPIHIEANSKMKYLLEYEYMNFEEACYITYSLPYITHSFQEVYTLKGENAKEYQIHASMYSPYKEQIEKADLVQRQNEETMMIQSCNWITLGSGFVAIVRKKH